MNTFLRKLESGLAHFDGATAAAPGLEDSLRILPDSGRSARGITLESRKEGNDIHHKPRIALCISQNTAFSRVSVTRCSDTQLCQLSQSTEPFMQLKGHQKTDYREADGWQPKSLRNSIWQGKALLLPRPP